MSQPVTAQKVRNRYLLKRGDRYIYRRTVPPQFREIIGLKEGWWITLKATTVDEALSEVRRLARVHDATLAQLKSLSPTALLRVEVLKLREALNVDENAAQFHERVSTAISNSFPQLPASIRTAIAREGGPSELIEAVADHSVDRGITEQFPDGPATYVLPDNLHTLPAEQMRAELAEYAEWQGMWRRAEKASADLDPIISDLGLWGDHKKPMTVSALADAWFDAVPRRPNTVRRLRMIIRRFTDTVSDPPVAQVTAPMMAQFFDQVARLPDPTGMPSGMREDASMPDLLTWAAEHPDHPRILATSYNTYLAGIKALFAWGFEREHIPGDPTLKLKRAKDQRGKSAKRRPFTSMELVRIVDAAGKRWKPDSQRYQALTIAIYSGMRLGELCGIQRNELCEHHDAPGAWFFHVKDNPHRKLKNAESDRLVPVHPALIAAGLLKYAESVPAGGLLFPAITNSGYLSQQFRDLFVGHANIPADAHVAWHSLRHSWADHAREMIPDAGRLAIMGHAERGVAGMYGHGAGLRKLVEWMAMLTPLGGGAVRST